MMTLMPVSMTNLDEVCYIHVLTHTWQETPEGVRVFLSSGSRNVLTPAGLKPFLEQSQNADEK